MPKIMLQKMLRSLCASGAEFHYPLPNAQTSTIEPVVPFVASGPQGGFAQDVPGNDYFHPAPEGDTPYYPPERHSSHVEIIMLVEGHVDFFINDHWQQLTPGRVHILMQNTIHTERHFHYDAYTLFWLVVLPDSLTLHRTAYSPDCGYTQSACRIVISPPMAAQLWKCAESMPGDEAHYFSLLVQCLDFSVANDLADKRTMDYHDTVLAQIKKYIDGNFTTSITLDGLSKMAHCSSVHLNRLFESHFGRTIHQYLLDLRFEEACKKLRQGITPGETARLTGFQDQRYFSRFFRKMTGMTPSEFQGRGHA